MSSNEEQEDPEHPRVAQEVRGNMTRPRMALPNIAPPAALDMSNNIAENWRTWKEMWKNYSIVAQLDQYDVKYNVAVFLHSIGTEGMRVYSTMEFNENELCDVDTIIKKFDIFTIGETNETYERYVLNNRDQKEEESFDSYLTAIRTMVKTCNFCDCMRDSLIRDRIVTGIRDSSTRKRLLQENKLTLSSAITICRGAEATSLRIKAMNSSEAVNKISRERERNSRQNNRAHRHDRGRPNTRYNDRQDSQRTCRFCAFKHPFIREKCPAWGQNCENCRGKNHFASVCKHKKKVHAIAETEEDTEEELEYEYISSVTFASCHKVGNDPSSEIYAEMLVEDNFPVKFQVDCGATVNILPRKYLEKTREITKTQNVLKMWNGSQVCPDGTARIKIRNPCNHKLYSVEFVIVSDPDVGLTPLLGAKAVQHMNILTVNTSNFKRVSAMISGNQKIDESEPPQSAQRIISKHADLFEGELGTLPGKVHLHVDKDVKPSVSHRNRVPIALREQLKSELERLTQSGVVIPVDEPSEWVSSLVIAPKKSGGIRICLDPKPLNQALQREHYELPTIEEVLPDLTNAKVFSTCDLSAGFWHLELDHESSMLCTFGTPFGRFRWTRLPFGLSVSPEIFQKRLNEALEGLPGVRCIVDDILIFGKGDNKETAQLDHDKNLSGLLQRCEKLGIKLKREKLRLCRKEVAFLGHVMTDQGLKCDPQKIKAVLEMPAPKSVEDVQRFSGFVNYLARYLPGLSGIMQPIRHLTHRDVEWKWTTEREEAFRKVKTLVTQAPVLAYYNEAEELTLQSDASSTGLGAVLLQNDKPIAYASRALSPAETRYAQIEKELLSVVFGLQKFHTYTFGRKVKVENDHKPLESITSKPLHSAPRRLQSMILAMQKYDAEIKYKKGEDVVLSDTLSRAYLQLEVDEGTETFSQVNMAKYLPITETRLKEIIAI